MWLGPAPGAQIAAADRAQADLARLRRLRGLSRPALAALIGGESAKARAYIESAARVGVTAAQLRLGQMCLDGVDGGRDEVRAMAWFRLAAKAGDPMGLNMVGRGCELGWGGPVEPETAARWYRRAAEAGSAWGGYNLANLHFIGRGVAQNLEACVNWLRRGVALAEHGQALNLLARCREEGWGTGRDPEEAFDLYRRSARTGYFRGRFNYATLLYSKGQTALALDEFAGALADAPMLTRGCMLAIVRACGDHALDDLARRFADRESKEAS